MPACPNCGSQKVWKDGLRCTACGSVQRYRCRECGYRFSENSGKLNKELLRRFAEDLECQDCDESGRGALVSLMETISLAADPQNEKRAAGATETNQSQTADIKGKLVEFAWWLKKQGYKDSTITSKVKLLRILAKRGADLLNPESVKEVIAQQEWSEGRKENAVDAYTSFLVFVGGKWDPPKYKRVDKLPFIPTEQELDALIAGCGKKMAAFLQLLKETGIRAGEAWNLKWTDLDVQSQTIRVTPEKGSEPRILRISSKCLSMIQSLPKKGNLIFGGYPIQGFARSFQRSRKTLANKLGNPRLLQISFHTFRHWKATMEYARTKDILYVMKLLGHKNIKNTLIYTQLIDSKEDEWVCKVAKTVEEAKQLIEAGFEYVDTIDGIHLYRKRK
jgi:integrase